MIVTEHETCPTYEWGHVTYGWVMSHMNESCPFRRFAMAHTKSQQDRCGVSVMSHTNGSFHVTHTNESRHVWMRHVTYEGVTSRTNESCHVYTIRVYFTGLRWLIRSHKMIVAGYESCHMWKSHVTCERVTSRMNESRHVWRSHGTYEGVMARINVSCLFHKFAVAHTKSHKIIVAEYASCQIWKRQITYGWVVCHVWMSRTGWRGANRMSYLHRSFSAKEPYD